MSVGSVGPSTHINQYQAKYDELIVASNQFLLNSTFSTTTAAYTPQYPFGSAALQFATLENTISVLKQAASTGLFHGSFVNTLA